MQRHEALLGIDVGAESGRGLVGTFDGNRVILEEIHRFPNRPVRLHGHLHWNPYDLFSGIVESLHRATRSYRIQAIGIDTWGVDFGLLGPDDVLLGVPFHYRDDLAHGMMEEAIDQIGAEIIFDETGIQFLPFNTLYQLIALKKHKPNLLGEARSLLMMGELFTFWLTGEKVGEFTNASTTQLLNPHTRTWSQKLFEIFDLPMHIMPTVVAPGTMVGRLTSDLAKSTGAGEIPVIVPAVHDTGSAVAAVPATGDAWCYISSGTWSLIGVESPTPVISPLSRDYNFTNEGGVADTYRLLKNVMGLWLLQECRRHWASHGDDYTYEELMYRAESAPRFRTLIDPDDRRFLSPGNMPEKIAAFARETGQAQPTSPGEFARCIFESLALKYRYVIERLEEMTSQKIRVIHVVGGGSKNTLLNQLTADATGRTVIAGPTESTAMGNLLVQAISLGLIADIRQAREISRESSELKHFTPTDQSKWEDAYDRLTQLLESLAG